MAVLDKGMKQRMVGALVLVALAVIFLPMLFTREDEMRQVHVEAPQAPAMPSLPEVKVEPVAVPEPQAIPEEPQQPPVVVDESTTPASTPSQPITPSPQTQAQVQPAKPQAPAPKVEPKPVATPAPTAAVAKPAAPSKIDVNGLPVSWSVQLASLSNRAGAEKLQQTLRSQGYMRPIVGITASAFTDDLRRSSVAGMTTVLLKPLPIAALRQALIALKEVI